MKKQVSKILFVVSMLCMFLPTTVMAGEVIKIGRDETFETLRDAYEQATDNDTIILQELIYGPGLVIDKNITIDLGGNAYYFTEGVGSTGTETNGFQILEGNTVTIKNGNLKVDDSAKDKFYILIQNYANLTLENICLDGTNLDKYSNTDQDSYTLSNNSGTINIIGKTDIIANDDGSKAVAFDVYKSAYYPAPTVNVSTTGKISGDIEFFDSSEEAGAKLVVSKGTFTQPLEATWCAKGYKPANLGNGLYGVEEKEYIAQVGEEKFETLQEAYNVAKNAISDAKITLLKDVEGPGLVIDANITVDFDRHTYTFIPEAVGSTGTKTLGFQILEGNEVTLKNGKLEVSDREDARRAYAMMIQNYANLTITDMTLDGTNLDRKVFAPENGTVYSYVLSNNSGTVNINGATTIIANDEGDEGKKVALDICKYLSYPVPTVNVSTTGKISGDIEFFDSSEEAGAKLVVSKGTFTQPLEATWCAEGYEPKDNKDGSYTVIEENSVAEVNGKGYTTLAEACENAASGSEVKLLESVSGSGIIINKDLTIDFGGYTYTFVPAAVGSTGTTTLGFQILEKNEVTLKNGKLEVSDSEDARKAYAMMIQNYANLTITDMTLDGTNLDRKVFAPENGTVYSYVLSNNSGTVNINGATTIIANDEGDEGKKVALDICKYSSYPVPTVNVSTTGKISGDIEFLDSSKEAGATLKISAGTFTQEIEKEWCANGLRPLHNEDGTWTVEEDIVTVIVIFDSNGGSEVPNYESEGVGLFAPVTKPEDPTRTGYTFKGWYKDDVEYDFTEVIKESTTFTLVAKWEQNKTQGGTTSGGGGGATTPRYDVTTDESSKDVVDTAKVSTAKKGQEVSLKVDTEKLNYNEEVVILDAEGNEVEYKVDENGNYVFTMPESDIEIKVVATEMTTNFEDVEKDEYYHDPVAWAEKKGITNGTHKGKFSPERACTRAEIITALWRAAGSPVVEGEKTAFNDVDEGAYYSDAVAWAEKNGIAKGTTETTFDPDVICSRSEMVTFLWRSQNAPEVDAENSFNDIEIGSFYEKAVEWALKNSITTGTDANRFGPGDICDRGQMVTFLFRLYND